MQSSSGQAPASDPHFERIRAEQVDTLYRNAALGVLGALAAAAVLAGVLVAAGRLSAPTAAVWLAGGVACVSFHLALRYFYRRARDPAWRPWAHAFVAAALADGVWWGCASVFLVSPAFLDEQFLTIFVAFGVATGGIAAFSSYLPAFQALFAPIGLLPLIGNLIEGGALHNAVAALTLVFIVTMNGLARNASANFEKALRLRFEKDTLADDLRVQKELAEEANLSKSRFLAAASHDLRQPIHALGMFVGALARYPMNGEMRRLVDHIEGSIGAMDGLFAALLDISKLDAGVVQSHPQSVAIGPLLERIIGEHMAQARQKGLTLTLCRSSALVTSDPILLERIVRNILSNAIRYTDRGRVLVGCRRGARLSVQIWDTGRGIAESERQRVFEEFYQVENAERDRGKGLGLGLAIVKRLTVLLDHPLELVSAIGKGSVFKLSLPLAAHAAEAPSPTLIEATARAGLIVVLDDERMVQEAMESLLTGWGHEVIIAGSGPEMLEKLAQCPRRPDMILCDYRLRGEENGVDVIRRLQGEYNEEIPAVLITGDTASHRLREAQESGFIVLNKPVANSKLRATIGNIMNMRARAIPFSPHAGRRWPAKPAG